MIVCNGWWHQEGLGKRSMELLRLEFEELNPTRPGVIYFTGSGVDCVGQFLIERGVCSRGNDPYNQFVEFIKIYVTHSLIYQGARICQETEIWKGRWRNPRDNDCGDFEIVLVRQSSNDAPIIELRP